jgi:hypothetical protein
MPLRKNKQKTLLDTAKLDRPRLRCSLDYAGRCRLRGLQLGPRSAWRRDIVPKAPAATPCDRASTWTQEPKSEPKYESARAIAPQTRASGENPPKPSRTSASATQMQAMPHRATDTTASPIADAVLVTPNVLSTKHWDTRHAVRRDRACGLGHVAQAKLRGRRASVRRLRRSAPRAWRGHPVFARRSHLGEPWHVAGRTTPLASARPDRAPWLRVRLTRRPSSASAADGRGTPWRCSNGRRISLRVALSRLRIESAR